MFYYKNDRPLKFMLAHDNEYCFDMYTKSRPVLYHLEDKFLEDHEDVYIVNSSQGKLKIKYNYIQDNIEINKIDAKGIDMKSLDDDSLKNYINARNEYESSSQFIIDSIVNVIDTLIDHKYFSPDGAISGMPGTVTYSSTLMFTEDNDEEVLLGFVRLHVDDEKIQSVIIDATYDYEDWMKNRGISENYQEIVHDDFTYARTENIEIIANDLANKINTFCNSYRN